MAKITNLKDIKKIRLVKFIEVIGLKATIYYTIYWYGKHWGTSDWRQVNILHHSLNSSVIGLLYFDNIKDASQKIDTIKEDYKLAFSKELPQEDMLDFTILKD